MSEPPIRVLVVDDDLATRLLAGEALADDFETHEAQDGREALEAYARVAPDAVLLDINMPELDGYEVCRRIRGLPGGIATSIMVMTASDDIDAVQRAFAAGATDFITKPLNLPLLAHRVRYMLRATATTTTAREASARLVHAQRLARVVHWQLTPEGVFSWASDPLGVFWPDAPTLRPSCDHLLALVHPEDHARVAAALGDHAPHELDFRLQLPDGSERVVHQDAGLDGQLLLGATQDVTELRRAEAQIAQLAFYDDLTGIPNRSFVDRYLRGADPAVARSAIAIELGIGQLDTLSTTTRDALVRAATARVIERVRGADLELRLDPIPRSIEAFTGPTLVARTNPDELLVVSRALSPAAAALVARQLAGALAAAFSIAGREVRIQSRLGVVSYPDPVTALAQLDAHARTAMYTAERTAPRDVVVFSVALREQRARHVALAQELGRALERAATGHDAELSVEYVPRFEPEPRRLIGVRARACFTPVVREPAAWPAIFAAEPALEERLARWTLAEACRAAGRWIAAGAKLRVAVEVPHQLVEAPAFIDELARQLPSIDPPVVDLELVSLPSSSEALDRTATAVRELRALGIRISLARVDDTCAVGELRRLALDALRIERATIDRLGPTFVETIASIARALGLQVAVADVDSPAALAALDSQAVHELAGAVLGAPVPAGGVAALVEAEVAPLAVVEIRRIGAAPPPSA